MPVTIGAKREADFSEPIQMLSDCHRRIERYIGVLRKVVGRETLGPEEREGLERALDYFRIAAPRHTADEEDSLFPRLKQVDPDAERLHALYDDHAQARVLELELEELGRAWLRDEKSNPGRLREVVAALDGLYERHIAVEENDIFPRAEELLGKSDKLLIGKEMAIRRGIATGS